MDFSLSEKVRRRIKDILPEAMQIRHQIHSFPETKFEEQKTMALIRGFLSGGKIELLEPMIGTDTVGLLRGEMPGPTVLLRADIDALPLEEASGKDWRSTIPGKAHSCGHDGHTSMLLAAAKVLEESTEELAGNVRFVFQPAEEEIGGGKALVGKDLLDLAPRPDVAFALHGWRDLGLGMVSGAPGPTMAAADSFMVTVRGKGGHGGQPHKTADPIVAAAQAISSIQTIVSRWVDPLKPAVVSVCTIRGGYTRNVIPEEVVFEGTVRYFDKDLQTFIRDKMDSIVGGACASGGCTYTLDFLEGYIPMVNDGGAVSAARSIIAEALGAGVWTDDHPPSMATEDFAYYLNRIPGCLLRLGLGTDWPPLHSPEFDFNDDALETGIAVLVSLALGYGRMSSAAQKTANAKNEALAQYEMRSSPGT